jgi:hypothetical protein
LKDQPERQMIDIAPTILDYLGQAVPGWMKGQCLLSPDPIKDGLIFSLKGVSAVQDEKNLWLIDTSRLQPPFYQFQSIQVVACNHWFELNLWTQEWITGTIDGHTSPCTEEVLPSKAELEQQIIRLLEQQGFDVSSLEGLG